MITHLIFLSLFYASSLYSATSYEVVVPAQGDVIWGMDIHPTEKNLLFFTERSGLLKSINLKTKEIINYPGVPKVYAKGQGGLLDILFDKVSGELYLTYSEPLPKGLNTTSLFRGKIDLLKKRLSGLRIFQSNAVSDEDYHFGSRIVIQGDYLYLSIGERNDRNMAQLLSKHHGKILRLKKDGSAPTDNPFSKNREALPEIYSYGHRNPQGLAMNSSGMLMDSEFGPRGGDEINLIFPGKNYGWPKITYGKEYWGPAIGTTHQEGMEQPLHYWVPSISPSGIAFYKNDLLLANLSGQHIRKVTLKDNKVFHEDIYLAELKERFRDIHVENDQDIYVSTDSGKILKLINFGS